MSPKDIAELERLSEDGRRWHRLFQAELERWPDIDSARAEWYQRLCIRNTNRMLAIWDRWHGGAAPL